MKEYKLIMLLTILALSSELSKSRSLNLGDLLNSQFWAYMNVSTIFEDKELLKKSSTRPSILSSYIFLSRYIESLRSTKAKIAEKSPNKYNVTEFFKDRKNKVEAEACNLRQERLRKHYPTWDFTFDKLGEEQLRMFVTLLDSKIEYCKERINMLKKKRYIEKQQQQIAESSSDKSSASASNRSHLSFSHNNNSSTATLSAHLRQTLDFPLKSEDYHLYHRLMLQPFHPNLMPLTMITPNDSTETTQNDAAFGHYDLVMRESYCPSSSWCYSSSSNNNNNNNNYYPNYLQNSNNNILQIHPHEGNLQVNNNIPAAPLMMREFEGYHHYGYKQHDLLQIHPQKFNYMDKKKKGEFHDAADQTN